MGIVNKTRIRHSKLKFLIPPFLIPAFPSTANMSIVENDYISDIGFTGRRVDFLDKGNLKSAGLNATLGPAGSIWSICVYEVIL